MRLLVHICREFFYLPSSLNSPGVLTHILIAIIQFLKALISLLKT